MIFPVDFSLVVSLERSTRPEIGRSYSSPFFRGPKATSSGEQGYWKAVRFCVRKAVNRTNVRWGSGGKIMIRKLASGEYRLYSRKINPKTGKKRNLGTFKSRAAAEKHERDVQYFKRH
jgi:hypothetical protein